MARTKPSCFCFCSYFALFRSVGRSEQLCRRPRVSLASACCAFGFACVCSPLHLTTAVPGMGSLGLASLGTLDPSFPPKMMVFLEKVQRKYAKRLENMRNALLVTVGRGLRLA